MDHRGRRNIPALRSRLPDEPKLSSLSCKPARMTARAAPSSFGRMDIGTRQRATGHGLRGVTSGECRDSRTWAGWNKRPSALVLSMRARSACPLGRLMKTMRPLAALYCMILLAGSGCGLHLQRYRRSRAREDWTGRLIRGGMSMKVMAALAVILLAAACGEPVYYGDEECETSAVMHEHSPQGSSVWWWYPCEGVICGEPVPGDQWCLRSRTGYYPDFENGRPYSCMADRLPPRCRFTNGDAVPGLESWPN